MCTMNALRDALGGLRRWSCDELGKAPQVLRGGGERELELGAARPAQSQATEPQDALQVCKQHLDALAITA
jgi:hypothetical protein